MAAGAVGQVAVGVDRRAVAHAERLEDVRVEVGRERLTADHFDEPGGDLVVGVVVAEGGPGIRGEPGRAEPGHRALERVRLGQALLPEGRVGHAGGLVRATAVR